MNANWFHGMWLAFAVGLSSVTATIASEPLKRVASIPLPNVVGRIDHMAVDVEGERLFIAALGNNTLEVVNLKSQKVERSVGDLHEPQGVAFLKDRGLVAVAEGEGGNCRLFNAKSFDSVAALALMGDADNVRYDVQDGRLYVGFGDGALSVYDTRQKKREADISLQSHPESFQLEANGSRIYVNLPKSQEVAVVDRKHGSVVNTWHVDAAKSNFPMALDETNQRLFVGCRNPPTVLVLRTNDGSLLSQFATVGDTDDLFYDASRKQLYVAGGEGFLVVYKQQNSDFVQLTKLPTRPGARTALFSPQLSQLFVALPLRNSHSAELWVYAVTQSRE